MKSQRRIKGAIATSSDSKKQLDVIVMRSATSVPFLLYIDQNIAAYHLARNRSENSKSKLKNFMLSQGT